MIASIGVQGLPSPRYPDSVFIIMDFDNNGIPIPVGTCFVVAPHYLLSCYHFVDPNKPEYRIATTVEKRNHQYNFIDVNYQVRVSHYNVQMDYCILELLDNRVALTPIPISIQQIEAETDLKVYHAPIDAFNDFTSNILTIFTTWVKCARPTSHHIHCQGGLFGGSSGAPFILRNGRVVAIHIESSNAAETVARAMSVRDAIELVSETVNSNTTVYGSISTGLYIARCPTLLRTLADIGADLA